MWQKRGDIERKIQSVMTDVLDDIDAIVDGGQTPGGVPSTVVDCTQAAPAILREGAWADRVREFLARAL